MNVFGSKATLAVPAYGMVVHEIPVHLLNLDDKEKPFSYSKKEVATKFRTLVSKG